MKEFTKEDISLLKKLIIDLYHLSHTDDSDDSIIGWKGDDDKSKSELFFMLSSNDIGTTHCIKYWLGKDTDEENTSVYQFLMETLAWQIVYRFHWNKLHETKSEIYNSIITGMIKSSLYSNVIEYFSKVYINLKEIEDANNKKENKTVRLLN
jgi:hypothetical protein